LSIINPTLLIIFLFSGGFASGKARRFNLEKEQLKLNLPKDWQSAEGLYGIPLVLLGPDKKNKRRLTLGFTNTGIKKKINSTVVLKETRDYEAGRKKWLKKVGGTLIKFIPYKVVTNKFGIELHGLGFEYKIKGETLIEKTQYFQCGAELFNVKRIVPKDHNKKHLRQLNSIVRGMKC
jgi:hypothetical protein